MICKATYHSENRIFNSGNTEMEPGKVRRGAWEISGCRQVRYLRFGLNMPGDPTYFGEYLSGGEPVHSVSLLLIKADDDPLIRLFGFRSYKYSDGELVLSSADDHLEVTAYSDYDHVKLEPGDGIGMDELLMLESADFNDLLRQWAELTASGSGHRFPKRIPTGWNDWQYYRNEKTEADILANCDVLAELRRQGLDCEFIQIDGGYCLHLSEWEIAKPEFPHGIAAVSEYIRRAGFKFGLWFAPYIQNVRTKVFQEHPEWFLRDGEGNIVRLGKSNVGESALVDYTVPGTFDWLREKIRLLVDSWQVKWIKLDGPNIGLYRKGVLHNRSMTVQQMLRQSFRVIADAAGKDVLIEGEGSMTAAAGLVDLHRVQTDNHPIWFADGDPNRPYAMKVYGKELIMSFLHRIWWCNHRENIILRDFPSPHCFLRERGQEEPVFTADEQRVQLAAAMIAPGGLLFCDPMPELLKRPELLHQADFLFPIPDGRTEILDPFPADGSPYPHFYRLKTSTDTYLAIFNWSDREAGFTIPEKGKWISLFSHAEINSPVHLTPHSAELLKYLPENSNPDLKYHNNQRKQGGN